MNLPDELSFIQDIVSGAADKYRTADWLLSDFSEQTWEYSFDFRAPKTLQWNIRIDDGSSLVEDRNLDLLNGLKYWLLASTRAHSGGGAKVNDLIGQANIFNRAIHLMDYLLLRSKQYKLSKYGLAGITGDDIKHILDRLAATPDSAESVYDWSRLLSDFIVKGIAESDSAALDSILANNPELSNVSPDQEDQHSLNFEISLLPRARAFLKLKDLYIRNRRIGMAPNTIKISNEIYNKTLRGHNTDKPTPKSLSYNDPYDNAYIRELPCVPVTTSDKSRMGQGTFSIYRRTFYNIGILHEVGLPAPSISDLQGIDFYDSISSQFGRFSTLPSSIVFGAVRQAIEFHLEYGKDIVNSWGRICTLCKRLKKRATELSPSELRGALTPKLHELGVNEIGMSTFRRLRPGGIKGPKDSYYKRLRSSPGMLELLYVYYGCVQIVVGTLTARRVGELIDLHPNSCLDESQRWLCFDLRKSTRGVMGLKTHELRPIEPIGAAMVKSLIRVQKWMTRLGLSDTYVKLFSVPSLKGTLRLVDLTKYVFNRNIDFFCDYFEVSTNNKGRRYYIRQHQLRRFFALLFFYSSSFGGLETLQWMLGHTDQRHVWNYITESIEGTVLRGAKAQFIAESIHNRGIGSYSDLEKLLESRFGTRDFSIVDASELEDYLEGLLRDGSILIEPEFFTVNQQERMRVIVKVTELANA